MLRIGLILTSVLTLVAQGASVQDPTYTTAYYTSVGTGLYLHSINNNGIAVGEILADMKGENNYGVACNLPNPMCASIYYLGPYGSDLNGKLTGVNDAGTFVGFSFLGSSSSGFIGSVNNTIPYGSPNYTTPFNVPGASSTAPYAINNSGTIVGGYFSAVDGIEHGFIYHPDGTFQTLDNPAFPSTVLVGINNVGQIVGVPGSSLYPLNPGFLYSGGSFTQLDYGQPVSINDSGAIAITVNPDAIAMHVPGTDGRESAGILYPNGTLALLYSTGPYSPQIPTFVNGLAAINNEGTIIFNSAHAFVGTPVAPEPASMALVATGILGLIMVEVGRRRRTMP